MPDARGSSCPGPVRFRRIALLVMMVAGWVHLAGAWTVPEATLRFTYRLSTGPTHPSAGYLVQIPDGGLLPRDKFGVRAVTEDGKSIDCYTLWHGSAAGLWVVLAEPKGSAKVDIYIVPGYETDEWTPKTGLTPGPLLVTDGAGGGMKAAEKLAGLGRIGDRAHVQMKSGITKAPLSVGGDDLGRPRPTAFYLQAYVMAENQGKTWFAPFFQEGQNEFFVDGRKLTPAQDSPKWGGKGEYIDLSRGLHRVEIFSASQEKGSYLDPKFLGHNYLAWRTPGMPASELGGPIKAGEPGAGTPNWAARIIKDHEIARSGLTRLEAAAAKSGAPVAYFSLETKQCFNFEGEDELVVCEFRAMSEGQPADTTYSWSFADGGRPSGSEVTWLLPGLRDFEVTLTAASPKGKTTYSVPCHLYGTQQTSIESDLDRRAFRFAMQSMVEAYPTQPDPCRQWSQAYWNNLLRTVDYGKGYPLLENLLGKRWPTLSASVSSDQLRLLQMLFLDVAPRVDPAKALEWTRSLRKSSPLTVIRAELGIREAELLAAYLDQPDAAAAILAEVARQTDEEGLRARIRLGDLQLLKGELNRAAEIYADVQQRIRARRQADPAAAAWKVAAIQDASLSANVATMVRANRFLEARQTLDRWEMEFPLAKISEDYILREAGLYMELGDWKRARWLLEPYCRHVDASSYLPDSALALLACMEKMRAPREEIKAMAEMLKERLEFHPNAADIEYYIKGDSR